MRSSLLTLILTIACVLSVKGQFSQSKSNEFIKNLIENLAEELPEDYDFSDVEEQLTYLQNHPINLNRATFEELRVLLFLSPLQINSLLVHISTSGKLIDVMELQSIPNFDLVSIERMLPFVEVKDRDLIDPINHQSLKKFGNHDLVIRYASVIEKQKGFTELDGSHYVGNSDRLLLRYKYNLASRITASLILEKDAGEKLTATSKNLFADYHSLHLAFHQIGSFKDIVIGDYSLQFGQGLTMWSGFSFGKAANVTSIAKNDPGLKAYTSANEYAFFRGIATTYQLSEKTDFTGFISSRRLDASLTLDENGNEVLSNINETGLHRTASELKNRNAIRQSVYGLAIKYRDKRINLGVVAHYSKFDHDFATGSPTYKLFDFTGSEFTNLGVNYTYSLGNCYLFGEIANAIDGDFASINGMMVSLSSKISTAIQYRNYGIQYHNFFSQAIAEGGRNTNEHGLYVSINIIPSKRWSFAFYSDQFVFPWLKFRVNAPSSGHELQGQVTFTPTKTSKFSFRYKTEAKQQNADSEVPIYYLENVNKSSYRIDANWPLNNQLTMQNRFEFTQFQKGSGSDEVGIMFSQDIDYSPLKSKLTGNIRLALFNTTSYNSRIYAYEDDVLYNFSFGQYSGKGIRTYLNLKYKILKKLDVWLRYAMFLYDANTVGSGLDEIEGNKKTDVKVQIRYQF